MWTCETLRTGIDRLSRTRAVIANLEDGEDKGQFYQNDWVHECGTPACTLGWATVACPEVFMIDGDGVMLRGLPGWMGNDTTDQGFHISRVAFSYLTVEARARQDGPRSPDPQTNLHDPEYRLSGKRGALDRLDLLIGYLRRRLAIMEVEEGEWGRQKPASQVVVGRERELVLTGDQQ